MNDHDKHMLRAVRDVINGHRQEVAEQFARHAPGAQTVNFPAPVVHVEAPAVTVEAPPAPDVSVALDLAPLERTLERLEAAMTKVAEAVKEQGKALEALAKALASQRAHEVKVEVPPRPPLKLKLETLKDGSKRIVEE